MSGEQLTTPRRRDVLSLAGAALAAGALPASAQTPVRPAVLLRGALVMTMDAAGDIEGGDVLVRGGEIAAVGRGIDAPHADVVDARGRILLPGLVDTHTHLWLSQMRGLFGRSEATKYFPLVERLGAAFTPADMRAGTLFGAVGAIDAGITTTFPYCDNIRSPEHAEAALTALAEAGIRARFLYTGHDDLPADEPMLLDHLAHLHESWDGWSNGGRIGLGLGWRCPGEGDPREVFARARRELSFARDRGLYVSTHVSGSSGPSKMTALIDGGFLGPDMLLVHATGATEGQLIRAREKGAGVSLTPITEQRVGFGVTRYAHYRPMLPKLALGIDGPLAGAPDMFAVMRMLHNVEAGASGAELAVLPRRMLELATVTGAEAVGLGDVVGSIRPGKRADLILVDPEAPNMGPLDADPSALLVYSAGARNVELVMVDGRIVKRGGALTGIDAAAVFAEAAESIARVRRAAG